MLHYELYLTYCLKLIAGTIVIIDKIVCILVQIDVGVACMLKLALVESECLKSTKFRR